MFSTSRFPKPRALNLEDEVLVEQQTFWVLRTYTVFNLDQVEGLDHLKPKAETIEPFEAIEEAEGILMDSGAEIIHAPIDRAFYDRKRDFITLPLKESFESRGELITGSPSTKLAHWTGQRHRLNREFGKRYGDQAYAFEELVAEMGAAFLCAYLRHPLRHPAFQLHRGLDSGFEGPQAGHLHGGGQGPGRHGFYLEKNG